jgi:protein O-mannosyl-transferase
MSSPRAAEKSRQRIRSESGFQLYPWVVPCVVVLLTASAFYPVLHNQFVNWDDYKNIVENPFYRGLSWTNIRWMFTVFYMGHYHPLTWFTLAADYLIWGLNPFGYHLTNLVFHCANAVVLYGIARRLFLAADRSLNVYEHSLVSLAAGFTALLFSIHPLRVESVAWATERRDVLSGLFFLLTILSYLKAVKIGVADPGHRRWMTASLGLYFFSLLSKASGMTLPVLLLVLDVYPLRRLGQTSTGWFGPKTRDVWREKIPFFGFAVGAGVIALIAQYHSGALRPFEEHGMASRLMQAFYGMAFYLWKVALPFSLSPLYEMVPNSNPWNWRFLIGGLLVLALSLVLFAARRRWPAMLACWVSYAVILAPTLGIAQSGPQLVADRYSYLSCMSWALLGGGGLLHLWQFAAPDRFVSRLSMTVTVTGLAAAVLFGFGVLTWKQTQIWHDSESLWRHALSIAPASSFGRNNLGNALVAQGRFEEAIDQFQRALRISPDDADVAYNLGNALAQKGNFEEAGKQLQRALQINPDNAMAAYDLGNVRARQGRLDDAIDQFQRALRIDPELTRAHYNVGSLFSQQGKLDEAITHFRQVMLLAPEDWRPPYHLGQIFSKQGKFDEAIRHYRLALRIDPAHVKARYYLAVAFAERGDFEGADKEFREALRVEPNLAEAHAGLARALTAQGKKDEAVRHYQEAVRLLKLQSQTQNEGPNK